MPIRINTKDLMKGMALIAKATQHPMAKQILERVLPELGVSADDMATLRSHDADYDRWIAAAEDTIASGGGSKA